MGGNFTRLISRPTGNTISGPSDDAEFDNIITNMTPAGLDDYSLNVSQMQSTADPYPGSVESLATSLAGELDRIRYQIKELVAAFGTAAQWYVDVPNNKRLPCIGARAFRNTTNQTLGSGAWTKVQLNAETFDTNNFFDSTTNYRFTPTIAGYYIVTWNVTFTRQNATANVVFQSALYKNGSEYANDYELSESTAAGNPSVDRGLSDIVYLNGTTDYIELYAYQNETAATPVAFGTSETWMSVAHIGA